MIECYTCCHFILCYSILVFYFTNSKILFIFIALCLQATCSNDGIVRIYEAPDVMNLTQWNILIEIGVKMSCSSISWCSAM